MRTLTCSGWNVSESDACPDASLTCEHPKEFKCSFKGCSKLTDSQFPVSLIGTEDGAMLGSTITSFCGDGDIYTSLSQFGSEESMLAIRSPVFQAKPDDSSTHCLDDKCLEAQSISFYDSDGSGPFKDCFQIDDKHFCVDTKYLKWNGSHAFY